MKDKSLNSIIDPILEQNDTKSDLVDLKKRLKKNNEIVPGGCIISNNDPKWECTDCHHRWGTREEDDDK